MYLMACFLPVFLFVADTYYTGTVHLCLLYRDRSLMFVLFRGPCLSIKTFCVIVFITLLVVHVKLIITHKFANDWAN